MSLIVAADPNVFRVTLNLVSLRRDIRMTKSSVGIHTSNEWSIIAELRTGNGSHASRK